MPLQRRLPKRGFKSASLQFQAEVTLSALQKLAISDIDVLVLKQAGLVARDAKAVKVIKTGSIELKLTLRGIHATAAAREAIEAVGGQFA